MYRIAKHECKAWGAFCIKENGTAIKLSSKITCAFLRGIMVAITVKHNYNSEDFLFSKTSL